VHRQPLDQAVHVRIASGVLLLQVLPCPAGDLSLEIIAARAKIRESERHEIDFMQTCDRGVHGVEVTRPLCGRHLWKSRIPEDASFDQFHDVERGADDLLVGAHAVDLRNRKPGWPQRPDDARLAIHGMRAFEKLTRRLTTQNIVLSCGREAIGGIGLAALELRNAQGSLESRYVRLHPEFQRRLVEAMRLANCRQLPPASIHAVTSRPPRRHLASPAPLAHA
jgi:hypothetical protein